MRKGTITAVLAAMLGCSASVSAADRYDQQPEMKVYMNFMFDGRGADKQMLAYGLRLDHDRRFLEAPIAPIAKLEFRGLQGLDQFQVNGMPLVKREMALGADGKTQYSWVDWGLIVAAVAGIGYLVYDIVDSDETDTPDEEEPDPENPENPGSGLPQTVGELLRLLTPDQLDSLGDILQVSLETVLNMASDTPISGLINIVNGGADALNVLLGLSGVPNGFTDHLAGSAALVTRNTPEYQNWLDGGMGHMGDLREQH
jgi:hypothetical protein